MLRTSDFGRSISSNVSSWTAFINALAFISFPCHTLRWHALVRAVGKEERPRESCHPICCWPAMWLFCVCLRTWGGEGNGTPLQYSCLENPMDGRLQSMGSLRVEHDQATSLSLFTFMHWRRKWRPTPVFMTGESQGQGSLVGCHLWGRTESDTTEAT